MTRRRITILLIGAFLLILSPLFLAAMLCTAVWDFCRQMAEETRAIANDLRRAW